MANAVGNNRAGATRNRQREERKPPLTFVGGIGGSAVVGVGVEASAGVLITGGGIDTIDFGFFYSTGEGIGFNVSTDGFLGSSGGDVFNLRGESLNVNIVGSEVSVTVMIPLRGGGPTSTVGIGPSIPVGGSLTRSNTRAISYRTLIRSTTDLMCNVSGNC